MILWENIRQRNKNTFEVEENILKRQLEKFQVDVSISEAQMDAFIKVFDEKKKNVKIQFKTEKKSVVIINMCSLIYWAAICFLRSV